MSIAKKFHLGKKGTANENVKYIAPDCQVCGKKHGAVFNSTYNGDGSPYYRRIEKNNECGNGGKIACASCLKESRLGADKYWALGSDVQANGGYRFHRIFTKNYCENIDGRLGFTCTTTFPEGFDPKPMLDVDHIDANHYNNDPHNLQTLCACCHRYKTVIERSHDPKYAVILDNMERNHIKSFVKSDVYDEFTAKYNDLIKKGLIKPSNNMKSVV
jgi:hypothetical protein